MVQSQFVTKAYLAKALAPLVNQNKKALRSLSMTVYQHKYYMESRGRRAKSALQNKVKINKILDAVKSIKKAAGLSRVRPNHKFANKGRFVRLGGNDAARLKGLLAHSHLRCARVPNGLTIPYLNRAQVAKLRRMLKNKGRS